VHPGLDLERACLIGPDSAGSEHCLPGMGLDLGKAHLTGPESEHQVQTVLGLDLRGEYKRGRG
jgi:hypothetical protein